MTERDAAGPGGAPRALVTAASRHGATAEIAEAIGQVLSQQGFAAAVLHSPEPA